MPFVEGQSLMLQRRMASMKTSSYRGHSFFPSQTEGFQSAACKSNHHGNACSSLKCSCHCHTRELPINQASPEKRKLIL